MQTQLKKGKKNNLTAALLTPEIGIMVPLLLLMVITGINKPNFFSANNLSVILCYAAFMGVLCLGQSLVIMSGEIDLSVGCNAGFGGVVFALCAVKLGLGPIASILIAILATGTIGFINGFLVAKYGLVNFVATLATMFICQGLTLTLSGGEAVSPLPDGYLMFSMQKPLNLSWAFFIFLGIFIILEIMVRYTKFGRVIQSTGGNKEATLMAGVNVVKVKWGVYILSGVLAALAGILAAMSMGSASQDYGVGLEFRTITACAVGGISLSGGSGSMLGVGIGILLINVLNNCLQTLNVESNLQLVITGCILILAVLFDLTKKKITVADSVN